MAASFLVVDESREPIESRPDVRYFELLPLGKLRVEMQLDLGLPELLFAFRVALFALGLTLLGEHPAHFGTFDPDRKIHYLGLLAFHFLACFQAFRPFVLRKRSERFGSRFSSVTRSNFFSA